MLSTLEEPAIHSTAAPRRLQACAEIGLILAIFFIYAGWPVPEVNETHYLPKAKHYWNTAYCARDFFLSTSDAHQVFYWTTGWLTRWLTLPAVAWIGRVATWTLLAWAWRRLSRVMVPEPLYAVLSGALFVVATNQNQMAGEWIVGGFEAKGFAYVLVLLGLEALALGKWQRVWPLLGAASAFHVVIGGWAAVAAGLVWLVETQSPTNRARRPGQRTCPALGEMLPWLGWGLLLALPGLLPALSLMRGADPTVVREANRIYVFERLPHHLVPQTFKTEFVLWHAALVALWAWLCWYLRPTLADRRLRWFVAGILGIALIGWLVSLAAAGKNPTAIGLLRYYWFRMPDIVVPLGAALLATRAIADLRQRVPRRGAVWLAVAICAVVWHLGHVVERRQANFRPPADAKIADLQAWREICEWAKANTPEEALFLTPRTAQTFRWYSDRAEVVSWKDLPQDARAIVEWWRRLNVIHRQRTADEDFGWYRSLADQGSERLKMLGEKFGADYVITDAQPELALERVSPPNPAYAIYRLPRTP